jgi:hypothetical protein
MNKIKYDYDREADVLYISFARSEHVITVELSESLVLSAPLILTSAAPQLPELLAA